ncbi:MULTISPECIES: (2Fe-2S)-binding protein [Streptomyces]|uniref:(2Fe-2S)-binding protein n=1 Tax=Streptomyces caniscabiei TaxID=2746961 RepID=A0ABU4MTG4_9ACTN|nr:MULTISPECIES: (2Fe-2S)-binding protein [Streptomyces]MBE4734570.1 (2Fe-2S)-binding protein [Streptomyces caniscabiei]MBE4755441.1 (2Fe-2S)-binding protein [Streptomyces caniscabiei]MBE4772435.1 (2Fe-2S)-binding protein [Streptomyces caniscabiei]MBE4783275.1 (2Fe-2S)-binding protein [Streptomyces caniscabiei]MBE4792579.1 (2Fe-2S)-binding protein [Streptomyces caniscabiei]
MPQTAPAPAPTSRRSPLAAAYARLTEVLPMMSVTELSPMDPLPDGEGWVSAAGLAAAGAELDSFLAWDEAQILRDHGREGRPDVVATFGLHRYSWYACLLFTVPWFLQRRVPRFPVGHVAFQREQSRLVVRGETFSCLPDDPAAGEPGARVVADEEALRAEVRAAFAEHIEPVLAGFGPRMRRRGRALWGMATDEVVEGIWYIAELLGPDERERCRRELELLLPGSTRPYVGAAGFRELTGPGGESLPTRERASCCMFYTLVPEDTCVTCPRTCETERISKLTAAATG